MALYLRFKTGTNRPKLYIFSPCLESATKIVQGKIALLTVADHIKNRTERALIILRTKALGGASGSKISIVSSVLLIYIFYHHHQHYPPKDNYHE